MIDTHTHLNLKQFESDYRECIKRALDENVSKMLVVGIDIKSSLRAIELSKENKALYPTAGIHPSEVNSNIEKLESIINSNDIVAVGECGIDLYWVSDNLELQKEVFKKQIELSIKYNLPLIIHMRNAFKETYQCLLPYQGLVKGVFHCFSGSLEEALMITDLGFHLGIGGVVTFKNATELKEVVRKIDLSNIILETDCPYLAPMPYRGKRNEPSYLSKVCNEISLLKNISYEEVDKITSSNAIKLFNLK